MTFSFSKSKRHFLIFTFVVATIQILSSHNVLSLNSTYALNQTNAYLHHKCIKSQGTYKSGSKYEKDINNDIKFTSERLGTNGYTELIGSVCITFQCRGDLSQSQCRSCLTTAVSGVRKKCPRNKGRIIWYDHCVLEFSSIGGRDPQIDHQNIFYLYNTKDVSGNKELFNKKTRDLLIKLKDKAIQEKNIVQKNYLYATGEESLGTTKLYAMAQCTKDLTRENCSVCLDEIIKKLPKCCNGKQGGRVLCVSCNFRYELYPFVNPRV